eukprot:7281630-Prymnesium_polylepis.1
MPVVLGGDVYRIRHRVDHHRARVAHQRERVGGGRADHCAGVRGGRQGAGAGLPPRRRCLGGSSALRDSLCAAVKLLFSTNVAQSARRSAVQHWAMQCSGRADSSGAT